MLRSGKGLVLTRKSQTGAVQFWLSIRNLEDGHVTIGLGINIVAMASDRQVVPISIVYDLSTHAQPSVKAHSTHETSLRLRSFDYKSARWQLLTRCISAARTSVRRSSGRTDRRREESHISGGWTAPRTTGKPALVSKTRTR